MSQSDAQTLEQYRQQRDALLADLAANGGIVRYRLMNREKQTSDPLEVLKFYEKTIVELENKIASNSRTTGDAANLARVRRD